MTTISFDGTAFKYISDDRPIEKGSYKKYRIRFCDLDITVEPDLLAVQSIIRPTYMANGHVAIDEDDLNYVISDFNQIKQIYALWSVATNHQMIAVEWIEFDDLELVPLIRTLVLGKDHAPYEFQEYTYVVWASELINPLHN